MQQEAFTTDNRMKWHVRYISMAHLVSSWSEDQSTKVGCVIVGKDNEIRSIGFNGLPRQIKSIPDRHNRISGEKYYWFEHAERNAIYTAARIGVPLEGCRLYLTWFPCQDCARAIVQAGLAEIIVIEPQLNDSKWGEGFVKSINMLKEVGVRIVFYKIQNNDIQFSSPDNY